MFYRFIAIVTLTLFMAVGVDRIALADDNGGNDSSDQTMQSDQQGSGDASQDDQQGSQDSQSQDDQQQDQGDQQQDNQQDQGQQ